MDLALQDIRRHLGKFGATIVGVGLLLAIVLTMNGIYRGQISDGLWLIDQVGADLWVVERGRGGPFNEPSKIPEDVWRSVSAVPGVKRAGPFITYTVEREVAGKSQQFTIIGYDQRAGLGGPGRIVQGRAPREPHYEVVADRKIGLAIGDGVRLGNETFTVVGLTKGAVDLGGNPLMYLTLADAQDVLYVQDNEALRSQRASSLRTIEAQGYSPAQAQKMLSLQTSDRHSMSAALVELEDGVNPEAVADHIESWLYLNAFTTEEERELMIRGRLVRMTATIGLFRVLLVIVSIVMISLIVYVLTMEKVKVIATLKLIGAPNWVIGRMILEQSLLLTLPACGLGYLLISLGIGWFPRTLVLLPSDTLITFAVMFAGGVLASLLGIWQAMKTPESLALGG
ncbi:MAG: ABC transporter permease [Deltaproteobacteria bacterium]|nr:ABC transporter permease [Deltaproteobacteria bacterium]